MIQQDPTNLKQNKLF